MVEAVRSGAVRPEAILITTFTRKAAGELLDRVSAALIAAGLDDQAVRVRRARIGTVDSISGALVQEHALAAGLSPRLSVLPEGEEKTLFDRSLSSALEAGDAQLRRAARRLSVDDFRDDVRAIAQLARGNGIEPGLLHEMGERSAAFILASIPEKAGSQAGLRPLAEAALRQLCQGNDKTKATSGAATALRRWLERSGRGELLPWADVQRLAALGTGAASRQIVAALREAARGHAGWPEMRRDIEAYLRGVFALAARALDAYREAKEALGFVDFADQEARCLALLERPDVREALSAELDLVLVDEFQDTSPLQLALFLRFGECARDAAWVGDPKQAIYGFRGADPALMAAATHALAGGRAGETLGTSWRSRPELVRFVNGLFGDAFADQGIGRGQVVLEPSRPEGELESPALESWVLESTNKGNDARALAAQIASLLRGRKRLRIFDRRSGASRPVEPRDVAVLLRQNSDCAALAAELADLGVPYELGRPGLLETPECALAVAGYRLLLDSGDTLAAATVSYLQRVAAEGGSDTEWLAAGLSARGFRGEPPVPLLREQAAEAAGCTPLEALRLAAGLTGAWQLAARRESPRAAVANLAALFAFAAEGEEAAHRAGEPWSHATLARRLALLASAGQDELPVPGSNGVRVSTWHGAKGLEWPVVVLYGAGEQRGPRFFEAAAVAPADFDAEKPLRGRAIRLVPFPYSGSTSRECEYLERLQATTEYAGAAAAQEAERLRLLYVGMTRARDVLVFAARADQATIALAEGVEPLVVPTDPAAPPAGWRVRACSPEAAVRRPPEPQPWLAYAAERPAREPAVINPSSLEATPEEAARAPVGEPERFGDPLPIAAGLPMDRVGTALHRYLAVDRSRLGAAGKREVAGRLLAAYLPAGGVEPGDLVRLGDQLDAWIASRWPGATVRREVPLAARLAGRVVAGRADVVIEAADGWALLDFKSFAGGEERLRAEAARYAAQVAAYRTVIGSGKAGPATCRYILFLHDGLAVTVSSGDARG